MKPLLPLALTALFFIGLASCSNADADSLSSREASPLEAPVADASASDPGALEPAIAQTYLESLLHQAPFLYSTGDGVFEPTEIADVPALFSPYSDYAAVSAFTVLDLDGDGAEEVVLQITDAAGDMGGYLILHLGPDGICGFPSNWRTFWELRTDGTFYYDTGSTGTESGIAAIRFTETGYTLDKLIYGQGEQYEFDVFFVNGQSVSSAEYNAALAQQEEKPYAQWYDFTEEALESVLPETEL